MESKVIEKVYTLEEREEQLRELIIKNTRLEDEKFILEMKLDAAEGHQGEEAIDLQEENNSLKEEIGSIREELQKVIMKKVSNELSKEAFKETNEVLSKEVEALKMRVRELEENPLSSIVEIKVDEELNQKNCELAMENKSLKDKLRKIDWTFLIIDHCLQLVSMATNKAREEVL